MLNSYAGWSNAAYVVNEIRNPVRTLKIAGPLGLAIVVGSSNMIKPAATVNSIVTAFAFLATMFLMAGMTYLFLARETKGQTLEGLEKSAAG